MGSGFPGVLSQLRRERGLSQRAAAQDLQISQTLLSHYENGAREPGLKFVCRACDYYGVTADYILARSNERAAADKELLERVDSCSRELEALREALVNRGGGA